MDIDSRLEELIEKYGIDRHYPAYRASRKACGYMRDWLDKLAGDEREFMFISMDEQALRLIKLWVGGGIKQYRHAAYRKRGGARQA